MINNWLEALSSIIVESSWMAPLFALLAGILTSFTPCSLSSVPIIIGYVGGANCDSRKALRISLIFAVGSAVTFTVFGIIASTAGSLLGNASSIWYIILGVLMILMALQLWGLYQFIPSTNILSKNTKTGYLGAFIAGILGGIFASPCATPVLVVLLALVASQGSLIYGGFLLLCYSIGHGALAVIAGTSIGFTKKITENPKYESLSKLLNILLGTLVLLIGFYMLYLGF